VSELDRSRRRSRSLSIPAIAIGAVAVGAIAIGVVAIARLAIGQMIVKKPRFRSVEIDELTVGRLRVLEGKRDDT